MTDDSLLLSASQQNRLVEGKHGSISIIAGADHAHDGGAHRGNRSGALVDFNNAHPVVVILSHKAILLMIRFRLMLDGMSKTDSKTTLCAK
ncbi:hypothetical protein A8F85_15970 [Escherichia coli]|nr:hypothetical protein A8F85_15970 [Escherichia coli]